jgi:hypothetical protein
MRILKTIILFVLFGLLFQFCKDDSPTEPTDDLDILASSPIGNTGGTVETDGVSIEVPVGSFSTETELRIASANVDNNYSDVSSTDWFIIDGVPNNYSQPLTVKLNTTGDAGGLQFIVVSVPCFSTSMNQVREGFYFIEAEYSDGKLTAQIPPVSNDGSSLLKTNSEGKFKYTVWGTIKGYFGYESAQKHFHIIAKEGTSPLGVSNLAKYFEDAYDKVKSMGYDYSRRTKWPIKVELKQNFGLYGAYSASPLGINSDFIEIKASIINEDETAKVTAAHEFFHFAQAMYEPFTQFNRGVDMIIDYGTSQVSSSNKFKPKQLWLDEASACWIETKFASSSDFTSASYEPAVYQMPFEGYSETVNGDPASYGYGMFPFIKYLADKEGEQVVNKAYKEIYKSAHPITALSLASNTNISEHWHTFIKELCEGKVISSQGVLQFKALAGETEVKITELVETEKTINSTLNELSAKIYFFPLEFTASDEVIPLNFSIQNGAISVFKFAGGQVTLLGHSNSQVTLGNINQLRKENARIYVVHSIADKEHPYTGSVSAPLKYSIQKSDIDLSGKFSTWVSLSGMATEFTFKDQEQPYMDTTAYPSDYETYYYDDWFGEWVIDGFFVFNYEGQFSGNTLNIDFSSQIEDMGYEVIGGSGSATYDTQNKILTSLKIDVQFRDKSWEAGTSITLEIEVKNVPEFNDIYSSFVFDTEFADAKDCIVKFKYRYESNDSWYQYEMKEVTEDGWVTVEIAKVQ